VSAAAPAGSLPSGAPSTGTGSVTSGPRGPQRRRQSRRRLLAIAVAVIAVVGGVSAYLVLTHKVLGGCGKSSSVTVWQDFSPTEFPAFAKAVTQFENETGVSVTWVNQTTPSPSSYVTAALACQAPDILIGSSDFAGGLYFDDFLANLSAILPTSAFSAFLPEALSDVTQAGAVFGFPLNVNGVAMIYNKQLVPVAPTTTDQMISAAQNATVVSDGKIVTAGLVYGLDSDGGYRFPAWQAGFGGTMFDPNGSPNLTTTATAQAFNFTNNFTTVDGIEPPGITSESTWEALFETGHAGIIFDGPWDILSYIAALGASNFGVAPMPVVSQTGDHPLPFWGAIGAFVSKQNVSGASNAMFNNSVKFAQFLATPLVEGELYNSSGDIPSLAGTFNYVKSLNVPFVNGFLDQFLNWSQPFPNTVQMTYFWTPFPTEASAFIAGSISASQAAAAIQASMITEMQQNHIAPY
jgi:arabinogalactan oligomer / maltooligosaccharide transport system substrate-binding protein